jgi:hypothetical protein
MPYSERKSPALVNSSDIQRMQKRIPGEGERVLLALSNKGQKEDENTVLLLAVAKEGDSATLTKRLQQADLYTTEILWYQDNLGFRDGVHVNIILPPGGGPQSRWLIKTEYEYELRGTHIHQNISFIVLDIPQILLKDLCLQSYDEFLKRSFNS